MRLPWEMALTLDQNWENNGDIRPCRGLRQDMSSRLSFLIWLFECQVIFVPCCVVE